MLPFLCVSVHTEVAAGARSDQVNIDPGTLCAWMQNYIYLHFFMLYLDLTSKKAALQLKKHCNKDEDDLLQGLSSLAMISTLGHNYS